MRALAVASDQRIIVVGTISRKSDLRERALLISVAPDGTTHWSKTFRIAEGRAVAQAVGTLLWSATWDAGQLGPDEGTGLARTPDGGVAVVGSAYAEGAARDILVQKYR